MSSTGRGIRVSRLTLRTFRYPTEDRETVEAALLNLLPEELRGEAPLSATRLKSAHKFTFEELRLDLRGRAAHRTLVRILAGLSEPDRRDLALSLAKRVEGGKLYLRLDKQELVEGVIKLYRGGLGGHVHLVANFQGPVPQEAILSILGRGESS